MRAATWLISFLLLITVSVTVSAQETTDYLISWEPNPEPDISGYVIYRSVFREMGYAAIDSVDNVTFSIIDEGLEKGRRYYYRIVAKNSSGDRSGFSNIVSAMTIPDDAQQAMRDSCEITTISKSGNDYNLNWVTPSATTGFIQYDTDAVLDSMSHWNTTEYALNHLATLTDPDEGSYFARAVAFDEYDNLTISAMDSFTVEGENPAPLTTPQLSIYPVPFHPTMGSMTMDNLPQGGSVKIYSSNGIEVFKEDVGSGSTIDWNGTNMNGSKVMSGVYYVLVEDSRGEVVSKRPIMLVN